MEISSTKSRLLLVDGDPKSLRVLDVSLKKAGFDVSTASSGRAALAILEQRTPDLIISDTDLEGMDGFELCALIKARPEWAKIPFLFVSGRKSIEDKIRGLELGVEDYLTKPIYIREIGIRVRTALQRSDREKMESKRDSRTRFAGDLSDVSVVDLVQTIELNRKSGIVNIVTPEGQRGAIFFRDGKVIDAEVDKLSGANAVYRLFGWSEGQFAVEFKPIRRFDVIDLPVAALLIEGMRRLDESARLLEKLPPLRCVVDVDFRVLAEELAELPDEVNGILRLFDGRRTLQEVIEDGDYPDLEALTILARLSDSKILFARDIPNRSPSSETSEKLALWLSESKLEDGAMADHAAAATESSDDPLDALTDGEAVSTPSPKPKSRTAVTMRGFAGKEDFSLTRPGFVPALSDVSPNTPRLVSHGEEPQRRITETFGEALVSEINQIESPSVVIDVGSTLKGVPVTVSGNRMGPSASPGIRTPQIDLVEGTKEPALPEPKPERRITASIGLAERILSEDSSVRAMALIEPGSTGDDGVVSSSNSERTTREYGNTSGESGTDIVREVVTSVREEKPPKPPTPAKPSKEVDWGPFVAEAGTPAKEASEAVVPVVVVSNVMASDAVVPLSTPEGRAEVNGQASESAASLQVETKDSGGGDVGQQVVVVEIPPSSIPAVEPPKAGGPSKLDSPPPVESQDSRKTPEVDSLVASGQRERPPRSARKSKASWEVVLLLGILSAGLLTTYFFIRSWSMQSSELALMVGADAAMGIVPVTTPAEEKPIKKNLAAGRKDVRGVRDAGAVPGSSLKAVITEVEASTLKNQCVATDANGKGKTREVAKSCRMALDANPDDADVLFLLARAELDRGKLGEARTLAKRAISVKPDLFDSYVLLGGAEQELGRIEEAKSAYRKYLELAPQGRHARELRAILSNL